MGKAKSHLLTVSRWFAFLTISEHVRLVVMMVLRASNSERSMDTDTRTKVIVVYAQIRSGLEAVGRLVSAIDDELLADGELSIKRAFLNRTAEQIKQLDEMAARLND